MDQEKKMVRAKLSHEITIKWSHFKQFVKNARGTNVYFCTVRSSNYTLDRHILIIKRILLRIQRVEENGTSSIYLIPKIHIYITIIKKIYCC